MDLWYCEEGDEVLDGEEEREGREEREFEGVWLFVDVEGEDMGVVVEGGSLVGWKYVGEKE